MATHGSTTLKNTARLQPVHLKKPVFIQVYWYKRSLSVTVKSSLWYESASSAHVFICRNEETNQEERKHFLARALDEQLSLE